MDFLRMLAAGSAIVVALASCGTKVKDAEHIVANPIDLNYRFCANGPGREAADPAAEYFKGKYYMIASKSGGYWSSEDLCRWDYIPCNSIAEIESYAPCLMVREDTMYLAESDRPVILYKTADPSADNWERIDSKFGYGASDPALFCDEDGEVYIYAGVSNWKNITACHMNFNDAFANDEGAVPDSVIRHNKDIYGWEARMNGDEEVEGWNEGSTMIRHNGKYYLQYASPGTELRVYADGVYSSDSPMGPFSYEENSPFSIKPGGFIGGAGHGHTFKDKYGNYWHIATMRISQRRNFERRLAIFPVWFGDDERIYCNTVLTDWPFYIPQEKISDPSQLKSPGWMLLSKDKEVSASSECEGHEAKFAADEQVETWWASATGNAGEWMQVDLGRKMEVSAVQVNFADEGFDLHAGDAYCYKYRIECSSDGKRWRKLFDMSASNEDSPHRLFVPGRSIRTRFVRITNTDSCPGKFSMYDLRIFGNGLGEKPGCVAECRPVRDAHDGRHISMEWSEVEGACGYIVHWGLDSGHLNSAWMIYDNKFDGRLFNRWSTYTFSIEAFNESGFSESAAISSPVEPTE